MHTIATKYRRLERYNHGVVTTPPTTKSTTVHNQGPPTTITNSSTTVPTARAIAKRSTRREMSPKRQRIIAPHQPLIPQIPLCHSPNVGLFPEQKEASPCSKKSNFTKLLQKKLPSSLFSIFAVLYQLLVYQFQTYEHLALFSAIQRMFFNLSFPPKKHCIPSVIKPKTWPKKLFSLAEKNAKHMLIFPQLHTALAIHGQLQIQF